MKGPCQVYERSMKSQCTLVPWVKEVPDACSGCDLRFLGDSERPVVSTDGVRADWGRFGVRRTAPTDI